MMDSDLDSDSDAMAQAMGFASFGAQKPPSSKRRKFNPAADAVVAAPDGSGSSILPPRPPRSSASASNAVPLGIRARPARNADEIDLGGEHDDSNTENGAVAQAQPATATSPGHTHADPVSASTFTNASMDGDSAQVETTAGHVKSAQPSQRGGFRSGGRGGHQQKSTWWTDYYDPSTNVNPWERLEQERGLQPRGPWMTWDEAKTKA